jgi:hypothetical protein
MSTEKGFTRITELVSALNGALRDMEQGRLGAQGLERATEDSRELYERLVVLRHKVREARAAMASKAAPPPPKAETPEAPAQPSIRLDTRPPETPRQTSLIDAIAEHEEHPEGNVENEKNVKVDGASPAEAPSEGAAATLREPQGASAVAPGTKAPSLAEKLEHAPIADLGKAITLSQKFQFLAELFSGQKEVYEQAITHINGAKAFDEAKRYVDNEVLAKLLKSPDPDTVTSFMDLVERRFK